MRILIVEDSSSPSQEKSAKLQEHGSFVCRASSVEKLAEQLRETEIDAILLDISQSDCSGIELFNKVRGLEKDLPIVVYSVHDDRAVALEFLRNGAQDYLIKGIAGLDSLARCLEYAVERNRVALEQRSSEMRMKKELERLVDERTEKLMQSNEELRQFAKVASHDLQEPLRAMEGFANLLAEATQGKLDEDCAEYIDYILDGAQRMKQLIQSILLHSQIPAAASIHQSTNCNSVIGEVLADLRTFIDQTDTVFEIDFLPNVAVERSQMVQLFQNLIGNSIKYRSDKAPSIAISAERAVNQWLFSVRDNGIGIESQYADKIFDMFSRLHSKGKYPGTGIGLAICKKIVTSHGGTIWVESNPGQGCIFMFSLPAVTEQRKRKMPDRNTIEILLVEDTPSDVKLTQEALKRSPFKYELTVVNDGVEAMEYLHRLKSSAGREMPRLILLDLNMPRKNGHEVLDEIKSDPELSPIPVVLLTVSERDEDVLEALRTKMNYYVAKPVTADKLSALIKAIHELHTDTQAAVSRTQEETHIRLVMAGNPHTSAIALAKLVDDPSERVRCRVAENARLTEELQMKLANDSQREVRISLSENVNLAPSVLELLAKDESEDVRLAVSASPSITTQLLRDLTRDENVYVSASATKSLAEMSQVK